jgi:hypothetical protein
MVSYTPLDLNNLTFAISKNNHEAPVERDAAPGQNANAFSSNFFKKGSDQISDWLLDVIYLPHRLEEVGSDPGRNKDVTSSPKRSNRIFNW